MYFLFKIQNTIVHFVFASCNT